MDDAEKLAELKKLITDERATDGLLLFYLKQAGEAICRKAYPYNLSEHAVPDEYAYLQISIAEYLWNKRGAEGQISHSENGIAMTWESGHIPDSMLKSVIPYCGVMK